MFQNDSVRDYSSRVDIRIKFLDNKSFCNYACFIKLAITSLLSSIIMLSKIVGYQVFFVSL